MSTTLLQAQQQFLIDIASGAVCPVCDRKARVYPYSVTTNMAKLLKALSESFGSQWVPFKQLPVIPTPKCPRGKFVTNYNMLKHFGVLEQNPEKKGQWRVTEVGHQFLQGHTTVPKRVKVCLDQCLFISQERCSFEECLTKTNRRRALRMVQSDFSLPSIPTVALHWSLDEAREQHRNAVRKGTHCSLCGRWNQVYCRALNCEMARVLCQMEQTRRVGANDGGFYHVYNDIGARGGEYGQMEYWGLIQPHPEKDGLWSITQRGTDFVNGAITVESHVLTLNEALIGFDGPQIDISRALNTKFDQTELQAA